MSVAAANMFPIRRLLASGNKKAVWSATTFIRCKEYRLQHRCLASSPLAGRGRHKSLYDVLGVAPGSNQAAIKEAFLSQSKKVHPDMVRKRRNNANVNYCRNVRFPVGH